MSLKLTQLKSFLRSIRFQPLHLILPAILALAASLFEGISIGLLIPTIKGLIEADLGFVQTIPVLASIIRAFPNFFRARNAFLFAVLVVLIFLASLGKNVLQYASTLGVQFQVRKFANNVRKLIYGRYLGFGKLFFDENNAGHLQQILSGYSARIAEDIKGLHSALASFFTSVVYVVIMFMISWKLTLAVMIAFPILPYSVKWLMGRIRRTSDFFSEKYSDLTKGISNALSCIPLVKAYTNEEAEQRRFAEASDVIERLEFSIDKKELFVSPLHEILTLFMFLMLVITTGFLLMRARAGEMAGYLVFFFVLRRCMTNFGFVNRIQAAFASLHGPIGEVMSVLNDEKKYYVPDGKEKFPGLKNKIEFSHVSFAYPNGVEVLKDVNFSIRRGETTALVGSSGSGKTTLVNLLMRFYDSPSASILIDGVDIRDFTVKSLRANLAYVGQDTFLFNDTLRNNMTYGLAWKVPEEKLVDVVVRAKLYDFVKSLPHGYETVLGDRGVRLSGGERQRVSIARAMLKGADILILDEATSAVDQATEELIQNAIEELVSEKTSIVIAHRLSTIKNADKVVILDRGQLVGEYSFQEFLRKRNASRECRQEQHA